ncbi:MAG: succinate:quinone oxidoreductase [Verrucomicrobia bacterium]|nr:MAG: succinate:quinone oxidoreductase [Verrucomicrobiota bacterium]
MNLLSNLFRSSLGKKYTMAVSGLVMFLFVIGHLAGNLQIFIGREVINRYGNFLQTNPEVLWPVRCFMVLMLVLHIWSASKLSIENKAARPAGYSVYRPIGSTYASRTMLMSGLIVFVFIIYHLLHYTVQVKAINLTGEDFAGKGFQDEGVHDIYKMMVVGFSNPWVSAFYVLGIALLSLHLSHGASSMFQTMGWKNDAWRSFLDNAARVVAWLIFLGYISIPVAILCGFVK